MNCSFWCDFTTKSELISSKMAEPCRLSPNACAGKPALAPPEKPFALFFEISPRRISFLVVKGVFWWFDHRKRWRRWGFAQAAGPPRYAPSTRKWYNRERMSRKLEPNDANNILCLVKFLKNRDSKSRPQGLDATGISHVYVNLIRPLLNKGSQSKMTEPDLVDFMGEILALSIYAEKNTVDSWHYNPEIDSGLTPDFLVNGDEYVEIYSPEVDFWKKVPDTQGFFPVGGRFDQNTMVETIEKKSSKYKSTPMTILVVIHQYPFPDDIVKACKKVTMNNSHRLLCLYGSQPIYDSSEM